MHTMKGGWVGQTFALAKCNESGGRKSRIRRSKEERKAMVENFIKKYQKLNSGSFPSLNLTHKEVGGSFYTVREIVREIIQENRVLGPAKLSPEEQNIDEFLEQYPLGSISMEPHASISLSSIETHSVPNLDGTREEPILNTDVLPTVPEHQRSDNGKIINGSQVDTQNKESDEFAFTELQLSEPPEGGKSFEDSAAPTAKVTRIVADVMVETFPLRPVTKPTDNLDGGSGEVMDIPETLEGKEMESVGLGLEENEIQKLELELELGPTNGSFVLNDENLNENSGFVDQKAEVNLAGPLLKSNSRSVDDESVENLVDPLLEGTKCTVIEEDVMHDTHGGSNIKVKGSRDVQFETNEQRQVSSGNKAIIAPNGVHPKKLSETHTTNPTRDSTIQDASVKENNGSNSRKGNNPTLDRINLESWEGTSKKSEEPETNLLLAIFKAFITAFVKFWSE